MFKFFTHRLSLVLVATVLFLTSCVKNPPPSSEEVSNFDSKIALRWNTLYLDVEKNSGGRYRPPQSARVLAYIGLANYEALVSGMSQYKSVAARYAGLNIPAIQTGEVYYFPAVYNTIYASLLKKFYPTDPANVIDGNTLFKIFALEMEMSNSFKGNIPDDVLQRSEEYGQKVANAVYDWSATDLYGHESYNKITDKTYIPPQGVGLWQPSSSGIAMGPYWGKCRLMAANDIDRISGVPPIQYSEDPNSKFYQQANEVRITVNEIKAGKDYQGRWVAEFWSDDMAGFTFTPAGRQIAILNQVIENDKSNLEKSVVAYAKMGMALNDAAVCTWALKYKWNVERPESYINRLIDKNWKPIMGEPTAGAGNGFTPPFPAYPSGHSTFGAAGSAIMADIFGYNFEITDRCHENRKDFLGTPRAYDNFFDMASENAYSRIPIGVHFKMDCDEGLRVGYLVGKRVNTLAWKK